MPRPGPRPYECVRRAWHSDRHQPIRGSLIQEIFRVVNEVHSSATKKNKEWQEKLPVVVLKAEEIMYSKANSAVEYMDLKTLWDRTNDAINTIIRRDESVETGELLQPCIEAALNLGCTPRRATRSQRNMNPRFYLSPNTQEPNSFCAPIMPNAIQANHITNSLCVPYLNCINATVMNPTHLCPEPQELVSQTNNVAYNQLSFATDDVPPSNINQCFARKKCPASSLQSVYPLYYGSCLEPETDFGVVSKSVPGTTESVTAGPIENLLSFPEDASTKISQIDVKDTTLNPQEIGFDLSLRLGSLPSPLPNAVKRKPQVFKDVDYGSLHEETKLNNQMRQVDNEFSVFTTVSVDYPLASCPMKLREHVKLDPAVKKRKAVFDQHVDNKQLCWQPKLQCGNLTGGMKSAVSARYSSENSEEVEDCGEEELNDEEQ